MNLGEASIVLRHRPALEVVDLTLRFVRSVQPKQFVMLGTLLLIPGWLSLVALRFIETEWILIWIVGLMGIRFLEIPFTVLCGHLLFEPDVSLRAVLRESVGVVGRAALSFGLYAILMTLSLVLIVGPLFVGANYFFLPEVLILEKAGPLRALKRSHQFLGGRSGTGVEGLMMRSGMLFSFVVLAETLGQAVLEHLLSIHAPVEQLWEDGGSPLALVGLFVFVPYGAAHRFLSYINERTRQDGWDIQVAFLRLAARAETSATKAGRHAA